MRTLLSQFCEAFDSSVRPLLDPLKRATETLAQHGQREHVREILPALQDVAHQFGVLADKVAAQQAYVLIFGPLKSGKSTLMNAMAAAYVSEVTSLPAYPCMVYVSDASAREFVVTRYDGRQETLHDPAALRMLVARAHTELAEEIRRVEARGEEFDPGLHFPGAIRRVDVRVPAGDLAESGSVLVDTPGLYSRMKFGYDRMTREFRNAAACAIFVVKTDNLFLEQVFEEFQSLLELFSRIFLVVNLDSGKRDLRPDGTLVPSLESADPIRIVEAFENLSMSQPLKAALDEGRLQIYPVDLMRAASRRLSSALHATDRKASARLPEEELDAARQGQEADFDGFMGDLTDYLNSTDYLVAFLGDSLRRALALIGETEASCAHRAVQSMRNELTRLEDEKARSEARGAALTRLADFDWHEALGGLKQDLLGVGQRESASVAAKNARELSTALDRWFTTDASLQNLVDAGVQPILENTQRALALAVHKALSDHVANGATAVRLPQGLARDLVTADLSFGQFGRAALEHVDPVRGVKVEVPPLLIDEFPVKKTIWDWVLFRSQASVRRRLFGPSDKPALRIPRDVKAKRLGAPTRQAMERALSEYQESHVPAQLDRIALRIHEAYAKALTRALSERIEESRKTLGLALDETKKRLKEYARILNHLEDLGMALAGTRSAVEALRARYQETDPELLNLPLEGETDESVSVYELSPVPRKESSAPAAQPAPKSEKSEV